MRPSANIIEAIKPQAGKIPGTARVRPFVGIEANQAGFTIVEW